MAEELSIPSRGYFKKRVSRRGNQIRYFSSFSATFGKSLVFGQEIPGKQAGEPGFRELAILDLESG
jgi:hypothetical protein